MLPFSAPEFFILLGLYIGIILLCKQWLKDNAYRYVLAVLNGSYLLVLFPQPLHFIGYIVYAFVFTWLSLNVFRFRKKIWGILLLLLPMLLVKAHIKTDGYPFDWSGLLSFAGLSYAAFRVTGFYMDSPNGSKMPHPVSYFNFLSFTPTLLIGPIERFSRYVKTESTGFSNITADHFSEGIAMLVKGIAFKYVFAEITDRYWLQLTPAGSTDILHMTSTMYAYYVFLFFDFAGYSWMAFGFGKMMGIAVPVNFGNPFLSVNPQDFWRRFHISLGEWLKDYFFTPLYMVFSRTQRLKKYPLTRQHLAMFLTFLLMGCWNGFTANFIISGALFGIYSVVHNWYVVTCRKKGRDIIFGNLPPRVVQIASIFIMINLVAISLYIFSGRSPFF